MRIANPSFNRQQISDLVSEKDKEKPPYLVGNANYWISHLVRTRAELRLAYNYFHGVREDEEFAYLNDTYGISNACDLEFIPLIRKHIEALKGMLAQDDFRNIFITCKDGDTIDNIYQEKINSVLLDLTERFKSRISSNVQFLRALESGQDPQPPKDMLSEEAMSELKEYYEMHWRSSYEISADNILQYILQSRTIDFKTKLIDMFEDLCISGSAYYRTYFEKNTDPIMEVCNPLHTFYNKNTNDRYIRDCTAVVYRFYRTPEELINRFGKHLSKEEIEHLYSIRAAYGADMYYSHYRRFIEEVTGLSDRSGYSDYYSHSMSNVIECFHVEWLANNKVEVDGETRYRLDRYSVYRLGPDIYILEGKDTEAIRESSQPYKCKLSYNGISNTDRNGVPYSLVLMTKKLQDKYDIYHFLRDNVVHHSGVKGIHVDASLLPSHFGDTEEERLVLYLQYLKQGISVLNSSQEGGENAMNTIFKGFDLGLSLESVQGYNLLIQLVEETVSSITGIPRQMLGIIEQRDAVANVQVGIKQGLVITKPLFLLIENLKKHCLTDLVDNFKKAYPQGFKGSILLGGAKQKIFQVTPSEYSLTDHDIHIVDSSKQVEEMKTLQMLAMELAKAQAITIDQALDIFTTTSITQAKNDIKSEMKKSHVAQLQQAMTQVQELQKQVKEYEAKVNKANAEEIALQREKLALERYKVDKNVEVQEKRRVTDKDTDEQTLDLKKEQIRAELAQLIDFSGRNNEIKNIV